MQFLQFSLGRYVSSLMIRGRPGLHRCESAAGRAPSHSPAEQIAGLRLYPVLMRAARARQTPFAQSIRRANKSRAVSGLAADHSGQREGGAVRITGPGWEGMETGEGRGGEEGGEGQRALGLNVLIAARMVE